MVQSFNGTALEYLFRVWRNKSLVIPHFRAKDIRYISFGQLKAAGIKGIVFDKDNTITAPYAPAIYPSLEPAYKTCLSTFGLDRVCILSNSAGSSDDKDFCSAIQIETDLGVHVIRHKQKKPGGIEDVISFLNCQPHEIATIGDRYFTDVLFGNLHGLLTIFTYPLTNEGDNPAVKILRPYEQRLVGHWISQNIRPPPHPLANRSDFIRDDPS